MNLSSQKSIHGQKNQHPFMPYHAKHFIKNKKKRKIHEISIILINEKNVSIILLKQFWNFEVRIMFPLSYYLCNRYSKYWPLTYRFSRSTLNYKTKNRVDLVKYIFMKICHIKVCMLDMCAFIYLKYVALCFKTIDWHVLEPSNVCLWWSLVSHRCNRVWRHSGQSFWKTTI